jgi:hypothetical protein
MGMGTAPFHPFARRMVPLDFASGLFQLTRVRRFTGSYLNRHRSDRGIYR